MFLFGNINKGLVEYKNTPGALLVDVREVDEFASGHIPGAINPLHYATEKIDVHKQLAAKYFRI